MKTILFSLMLVVLSLVSSGTCSAQLPQWVTDLANANLSLAIGQITHWEEKQMTWYNINGQADGSDSISVNTLYVKGITTDGKHFIGAISETSHELNPLGSRGIKGHSCTGECGCQCCDFRKDGTNGCDCGTGSNCCVSQPGCSCWCRHAVTSGN